MCAAPTARPSIFMSSIGAGAAAVILAGNLVGCAVSESHFDETRSATGIGLVSATMDAGDFTYNGGSTGVFSIDGSSWGMAFKEEAAAEHKEGNELAIDTAGGALRLDATSRSGSAGIHLDVDGPQLMGMDLSLDDGDAQISDVIGFSLVTADSIRMDRVEGGADLFARSGSVNVDLFPAPGETIIIEAASGSVDLTLPYGGSYDLQIWGDPEYMLEVDDLGFHSTALDVAYFAGRSGRGDTRITVIATGGDVRIRSAW